MLIPSNKFLFLNSVIEHYPTISKEYQEAKKKLPELKNFFSNGMPPVYSHFEYWIKESGFHEEETGYDARGNLPVGGFPLFKKGFPIKWMNVNKHFPSTLNLLNNIPGLTFAQFSIMSPGSEITAHKHPYVDTYIFHINLFDLNGKAIFKAGSETKEYKKAGEHFLFQPKEEHESKNQSDSFRVNFMFEFKHL